MPPIESELWALFVDEASGAIGTLDRLFDEMADGDAASAVNAAFRAAHNLKGSARVAGATNIERAAHAIEDVLAEARAAKTAPPAELLRTLRTGLHVLTVLVARPDHDPGVEAFVASVRAAREGAPVPAATNRQPEPAAPAPAPVEAPATVRIDAARLDDLLQFAGEFMVAKSRRWAHQARLDAARDALDQVERALPLAQRGALRAVTLELASLAREHQTDARRFDHTVDDWSLAIKRARMLPLAGALNRWRVVVADAAAQCGREVRFVTEVGAIEIDREVLDALQDPVMHVLRNAVDHGIEPADERIASNKPPIGTITLRARAVGAMVEITISDDGRGLDAGRILARAVQTGLLDGDTAERLGPADVAELLFAPGFTTREAASAVSGRGVGLDVVRRRLVALGGQARLQPAPGGGVLARLEAPSTVVSALGLLVRAGGVDAVVPSAYLAHTARVDASAVHEVDGGSVVRIGDAAPVRVRWLASVLQRPRTPDPARLLVVVVDDGSSRLAVVVDAIVGEIEFVTRRLPWNVPPLHGVSGAMITGDGSVGLVIDAPRLFGDATAGPRGAPDRVVVAPVARKRRVLVVDDSLTSRTLERNILVAAGYDVEVAVDGEAAWNALGSGTFDLVVTDVEMPAIDGFELTRRIRASSRTKSLPVILVTSLDAPGDVANGAAAGADEYIVKGKFDQQQLLEAVARLV